MEWPTASADAKVCLFPTDVRRVPQAQSVMDDQSLARSENDIQNETASLSVLIEIRWRARGPSQHVIACGIYREDSGIHHLRAHFGDGEIMRAQPTRSLEEARLLAGEWLDIVLEQGGFELLSATPEN